MNAASASPFRDLWDEAHAAGLTEPERLIYRARLLGSDPRITHACGGSVSAKLDGTDPLTGDPTPVLQVSGPGADLAALTAGDLTAFDPTRIEALRRLYRGPEHEDEMIAALGHCAVGPVSPPAPVDALLHALLPRSHVDHVHPDAILVIASAKNSRELTLEVYGESVGWLPWRRPGFELALAMEKYARANPDAGGIVLEGHGLVAWGDDPLVCYRTTLAIINRAAEWLADKTREVLPFGGLAIRPALPEARRAAAARLMPAIRGHVSADERKLGHFDDSDDVLEFVDSRRLRQLAALGACCPDHYVRTRIRPVVIDASGSDLEGTVTTYRTDAVFAYDRLKGAGAPPMRDPNPVVFLVPGVGMMTFAATKPEAESAAALYRQTIRVMRGASVVDIYTGLPEPEAFAVEYGSDTPVARPDPLAGLSVLIAGSDALVETIAGRLAADGAAVTLGAAEPSAAPTECPHPLRRVNLLPGDEASVARAFADTALAVGAVDALIVGAPGRPSAPIEDARLDDFGATIDAHARSALILAREAVSVMRRQKLGGSLVFMVRGGPAGAYSAAVAAEIELARVLAAEGAPDGIRANVVRLADPLDAKELPAVAKAVAFLASPAAVSLTGNVIDAGAPGSHATVTPS